MHHWLFFSRLNRQCVSLVFDYEGVQYIKNRQWYAKVNIVWLEVRNLHATINRKTWRPEPESETDDYQSGLGPPRTSWSTLWMILPLNRTVYAIETRTAGGLPGPVSNCKCNPKILELWATMARIWFPLQRLYRPPVYLSLLFTEHMLSSAGAPRVSTAPLGKNAII